MKIAVVGGGLSGIRAALTLGRAGHAVTLLEKNRHLGGRVFSFRDPALGEIDIGQHVWLKCCVALERLLADLAIPDALVFRQKNFAIPFRGSGGVRHEWRAAPLPFPLHLLPGALGFPGLGPGDLLRLGAGMARARLLSGRALVALDAVPFSVWLARAGQTPAAIAKLWAPLALAVCNQRPAELSARHALFTFRASLLNSRHAADLCFLRAPLSEIFHRRARLALADAGVRVLTGAAVRAVAPGARASGASDARVRGAADQIPLGGEVLPGGAPARVTWTGAEAAAGEFAGVVLAVPAAAARAWLPELPPPAAGATAIAGLLVRYAAPVMDDLLFAALDSPVQWVFNKSALWGGDAAGGQLIEIVISGAARECAQGGERTAAELLPALAKLLPKSGGMPIVAKRFLAHRAAAFAVPPGAEARRLPVTRPDFPGLYFAGDHAATGWPSTMESAVRAGERAAAALLGRA